MKLAVLSCGSIVVEDGGSSFLFGAPKGINSALKESGISVPTMVFTTNLKSPGIVELDGDFVRYKEQGISVGPSDGDTVDITTVETRHGLDYVIKSDDGSILYSERGDVSSDDVSEHTISVIRNKHRSDKFKDNVITWPWIDAEYIISEQTVIPVGLDVSFKVWSSLDDVPSNLKKINGTPLSLDQANFLAKIAKASADDTENYALAINAFKKSYVKKDGVWTKKEKKVETKTKDYDEVKLAQSEVKYKADAGKNAGIEVCANCKFFLKGNNCKKVKSEPKPISPIGYCILWKYDDPNYSMSNMKYPSEMAMKATPHTVTITATDSVFDRFRNFMQLLSTSEGMDEPLVLGMKALSPGESLITDLAVSDTPNVDVISFADKGLLEYILKEMGSDGLPIRRLGDVFVAKLHTAYNDYADWLFSQGIVNQEERMLVGKSIGRGLKAVKTVLTDDLYQREIPIGIQVPESIRSMHKSIPEKVNSDWKTVFKDTDGNWRWASVTSVAIKDRQKETFTQKAMDWAILFAKTINNRGPLRYKHLPGLDGGRCDRQARIGDFLVESGTFSDTPLGKSMRVAMKEDPTWRISAGLLFGSKDLDRDGNYHRAIIFERSMTKDPAVPITAILQF